MLYADDADLARGLSSLETLLLISEVAPIRCPKGQVWHDAEAKCAKLSWGLKRRYTAAMASSLSALQTSRHAMAGKSTHKKARDAHADAERKHRDTTAAFEKAGFHGAASALQKLAAHHQETAAKHERRASGKPAPSRRASASSTTRAGASPGERRRRDQRGRYVRLSEGIFRWVLLTEEEEREDLLFGAEPFLMAAKGDLVRLHLNLGLKFRVHRKKTWSVKDRRGAETVGHVYAAILRDAVFTVRESGAALIQAGGRKTVHAWVSGKLVAASPPDTVPPRAGVEVKYNPHIGMTSFMRQAQDGSFSIPVAAAKEVYLSPDWKVYATGLVDAELA